jgi:glutamyl-tRNA reductase
MNLYCFGVSHHTATVEQREQLAFVAAEVPTVVRELASTLPGGEAVLLATCNRAEFYLATTAPAEACRARIEEVYQRASKPVESWRMHHYHHAGADAVRHLFEVSSGIQSMVIGETEILGQVKDAYELSRQAGATGKFLNRAFQSSFSASKEARTETGITRGSVSVGSVAVDLAERIFGHLKEMKVMILGAGDTSERVARTLYSKGVHSIFVANRHLERAQTLAAELEGQAVPWENWAGELSKIDIIISSTSAPHYVLTREQLAPELQERGYRPLFLIDLAVPRDIEPTVAMLDSVYLYDIDDLQSIAQANIKERELEIVKCRALLHHHETRFLAWHETQAQRLASHPTAVPADPSLREQDFA